MFLQIPVRHGGAQVDDYGPTLRAVGIAFTTISAAAVVLRFVSRTLTRIQLGQDDWLLLAAAILSWTYGAIVIVEVDRNYYGQHVGMAGPFHVQEYMKGLYALAIIYPMALTLSKLSLLALYWRIFRTSGAKRPIQVTALLNVSWMLAAVPVGVFSCRPIQAFWDASAAPSCIREYDFFLANECITIALDIAVLVIPLWSIANIQRTLSQRISIGSTFALGFGATIVSGVRLWQLIEAGKRPGTDPTFDQIAAGLWATVEVNVWVIVASIPIFRPLAHDLYGRMFRGQDNSATIVVSGRHEGMRIGKGGAESACEQHSLSEKLDDAFVRWSIRESGKAAQDLSVPATVSMRDRWDADTAMVRCGPVEL